MHQSKINCADQLESWAENLSLSRDIDVFAFSLSASKTIVKLEFQKTDRTGMIEYTVKASRISTEMFYFKVKNNLNFLKMEITFFSHQFFSPEMLVDGTEKLKSKNSEEKKLKLFEGLEC